ncbi:DUF2309 domain-containing protein [Pseudidiomarina homiensis]|uniref:DUF2309 domain-containing protein n=1 Tax=Pseudidiomarina homiensis TaxID=364198 RepID=UPI00215AF039|nr:DUF2309 domain-containing protein [Pseudidiomarina homiensis]
MSAIDLQQLGKAVCKRVAPVWPLPRSIAVNPWWQERGAPIREVAEREQTRKNVRLLMPAAYYQQRWLQEIQPEHLQQAAQEQGVDRSVQGLVRDLRRLADDSSALPTVAQVMNSGQERTRTLPWRTEIVHQLSQFCALWVNYPEQFNGADSADALYLAWLDIVRHDRGIELLVGERRVEAELAKLPRSSAELWQQVEQELPLAERDHLEAWLQVALHDIYGWASVFAQRRWARELENSENVYDELDQLLAIRVAWELVCWRLSDSEQQQRFVAAYQALPQRRQQTAQEQALLWVWQRALELSYQQELAQQLCGLQAPASDSEVVGQPSLQAVFCIDVRSEPMRRALEAQHEGIETFGFAGFFGLPVEYQVSDTLAKPQLPGLLAPQFQVTQAQDETAIAQRTHSWRAGSWHRSLESPAGAYGWVEMSGLAKIWKLLERSLWPKPQARIGSEVIRNTDWLITKQGQQQASIAELAALAANALTGMGLTEKFAPQVLIVGHTACVTNNPHAASLDCGACGGQSGEVNARVLVQLFNDPAVRQVLAAEHRIEIPQQTQFFPALHDTTQQQLRLLTTDGDTHVNHDQLEQWLAEASSAAQHEQRNRLADRPKAAKALQQRAANWAEVRPEWGLARNAAIIFAPREATAKAKFDARAFLHTYHAERDPEQAVLTQLMTAPMVVAHWINMQYYGSMTAPQTFGSGNKLLHNVVADGVGVFEGNGGDLRIGLARQSLHDGQDWYHQPLRLTVVIAAPTTAIDRVITEQTVVRELIDNEWLYLWQWDPRNGTLQQRTADGWHKLAERQETQHDLAI